jgi:hypothetical protein
MASDMSEENRSGENRSGENRPERKRRSDDGVMDAASSATQQSAGPAEPVAPEKRARSTVRDSEPMQTPYRLVFCSAYDLGARRCQGLRNRGAIWYPDKGAALVAAHRLARLGERLLIEPMGGEPEPIAA